MRSHMAQPNGNMCVHACTHPSDDWGSVLEVVGKPVDVLVQNVEQSAEAALVRFVREPIRNVAFAPVLHVRTCPFCKPVRFLKALCVNNATDRRDMRTPAHIGRTHVHGLHATYVYVPAV
jgi:hypothetical protein